LEANFADRGRCSFGVRNERACSGIRLGGGAIDNKEEMR
jgi:hypothetical protein